MKRYIDANKAKIKYSSKDVDNIANLFNELIDSQPTVDAVEVVRCEDCEYWYRYIRYRNHNICDFWSTDSPLLTKHDDYCSYGERRK